MTEETPGGVVHEAEATAADAAGPAPLNTAHHDFGSLVLASIRDAVIVTDAAGHVTMWNRGAEHMFGEEASWALGRDLLAAAGDREFAGMPPLVAAVEADQYWTGDVVLPGPEGDRIIDVVTYPLTGGAEDAARVFIAWDVTAERRMAHADALLAAVVEQAEDAIITVDRDCAVVTWNGGAERLLGIAAADAIGRETPFTAPEEERERLRRGVFETGRPLLVGGTGLRAADGSVVPVSLSASPIRDPDGEIRRLAIIARDERPRAATEREVRFRDAILENTDEAVVASDADRRITFWSRGAERLFGIAAADAIGAPSDDVMPSGSIGVSQAEVTRRLGRGEAVRTDVEFTRADGTTFIGEVSGNMVAPSDGGERVYLGVIRDVTDARETARDAARLAAIVVSAADVIFSADDRMIIRSWNPGAERVLGYRAADIIGRTIAAIVAQDRLPEAMALRDAVLHGAPSSAGELEYVARSGERIPVWVSHAPVLDGTRVVAVSTIAHDLRDRKAVEEQLRQAQKLDAVGRLGAGIAHDFSNLLTAVTGYATLILADLGGDDPAAANARQILHAAERAGDLTRSLLALSSGRPRDPEVLAVDDLVEDLAESLRRLLPEGGDLRVTTGGGARVNADPTDLEIVLVNLVTNAGEAMGASGRVDVAVRSVNLDAAFAATHLGVQPGPHVELVVSDTGSGLTAEARARLFEPMFTTKAPGTFAGMGLATVRASVERAGGTIWVDPGTGSGTTFRVYLPAVPGTSVPDQPGEDVRRAPRGGTERVLLVEDDMQVRALASTILTRAGYRLTVKGDPRQALELDPASVDLLVSDVVMPHLTGPSLAAHLLERRPDLRVLFMSGFADGSADHDLGAYSGRPLLAKPFGPVELLEAVRAALDAPA